MNNNQNIPQGYKDSPLGIIPQEWEVKRFDDIAPLQRGFDLPINNIIEGDYPVVLSNGIQKYHNEFRVKAPGIVTGRSGTIGKVFFVSTDFWPHNTSLWVTDFKKNNPKYIYYFITFIDFAKLSSGSGVPTLNRNDIHCKRYAIPPPAEQEKIAEVLGVWDEAIERQTKLTALLEKRKQALMQRLLKPKKHWEKVRLGDISERVTRMNTENNTNVMTISAQRGFVSQTDFFNKTIASETLDGYFLVCKDEFCYNKSYSNGYPMGAIKRLNNAEKAVVTTLYICFMVKSIQNNIDFLEQYFEAGLLNRHLMKIAHEGGRAHGLLNVTPSDFFEMQFKIPPLPEQTAIAEVLSTADSEIALARKKLESLRTKKKGLMQQLLTGKKRVKI